MVNFHKNLKNGQNSRDFPIKDFGDPPLKIRQNSLLIFYSQPLRRAPVVLCLGAIMDDFAGLGGRLQDPLQQSFRANGDLEAGKMQNAKWIIYLLFQNVKAKMTHF